MYTAARSRRGAGVPGQRAASVPGATKRKGPERRDRHLRACRHRGDRAWLRRRHGPDPADAAAGLGAYRGHRLAADHPGLAGPARLAGAGDRWAGVVPHACRGRQAGRERAGRRPRRRRGPRRQRRLRRLRPYHPGPGRGGGQAGHDPPRRAAGGRGRPRQARCRLFRPLPERDEPGTLRADADAGDGLVSELGSGGLRVAQA